MSNSNKLATQSARVIRQGAGIFMLLTLVGCQRQTAAVESEAEVVSSLLSNRARRVVICLCEDWMTVTNGIGQVLSGWPNRIVGSVTNQLEVASLTASLAETGRYGNSGACLCGALPKLVFLDEEGAPLISALVHVDGYHVIISTNQTLFNGVIFSCIVPNPSITSGNNPRFGKQAHQLIETLCPDIFTDPDYPRIDGNTPSDAQAPPSPHKDGSLKANAPVRPAQP